MIQMTCSYRRGGVLAVPHGPPDATEGAAVDVGPDGGGDAAPVPD